MSVRFRQGLCLGLAVVLSLSFTACALFSEGFPGGGVTDSHGVLWASSDRAVGGDGTDASDSLPDSSDFPVNSDSHSSESSRGPVFTATTDSGGGAPSHTDGGASSISSSAGPSSSAISTQTASTPSDFSPNSGSEPEDTPAVNTDISPVKPAEYYGRVWLSTQKNGANLVKTYDALVAGVGVRKDTVSLSTSLSQKEFETAWMCFTYDYPHYFWLGHAYRYSFTQSGKVISVTPEYTMGKGEIPSAQSEFNAALQTFIRGIHSGMTQYEIEKTLHDRLILACTYTASSAHAHDAYGALVEGKAVCEGFANGFTLLCRAVGIEALVVTGSSANPTTGVPEGHAWNIVKIDGAWYHIDVTWDNAGEPDERTIHYAWFNLPTSWITQDHTLEQEAYAYPDCTSDKENYYLKKGTCFSELSEDAVVKNAVKSGNTYIFQGYLQNQSDVSGWFSAHAKTISKAFGLNGYRYGLTLVGKEVIFTMGPYEG